MTSMDPAALTQCQENQGTDCTCLSCHTSSFDPTAQTVPHEGVTCEACHGKFVEGHPENGEMKLSVDSSVCSECHTETHKSWENTEHAQAGVQCIGCHRSHTQNLRLDDEGLCTSCHRDRLQDGGHAVHIKTGVNCIDCHTSPATMIATGEGQLVSSHQFAVATDSCASCHGQTFHEDTTVNGQAAALGAAVEPVLTEAVTSGETPAEIVAEQGNRRWLQGATALSFGLGIGFGAMVGIVFMLVIGLIVQRSWRAKS
jgi:formate-dependent nitrite reductase cytochrome c552 subunit